MRVGIIGGGRAARVMARNFARGGHTLTGVVLRDSSASAIASEFAIPRVDLPQLLESSELVVLAVSDTALPSVAASCASLASPDLYLFHLSGAHASALFARPRSFALHPLRALRGTDDDLSGALIVFDGDAGSEPLARRIVAEWKASLVTIDPAEKAKYHAAAVFASNFVAVLLETSQTLMQEAGVEVAPQHLADLAASAISNWREHAGAARFTGPIARGDAAVVEGHLQALNSHPHLQRLYGDLSRELVRALLASSPERTELKEIERQLTALHVS